MNLIEFASISLTFFFGLLAIALSIKEGETRKSFLIQTKLQKQKIFETSILKEIQDRIGYSLDISEVIDVITGSLKHIFPYSAASSMVLKNDEIVFKTYIEEPISHRFIEDVKKSMQASLNALLPNTAPGKIEEVVSGVPFDDMNQANLSSFFHIPLVVGNNVVGLINLSSVKPNLYKEDEMTILYQITNQASNALTRLHDVLETEKGKLTSMIASLSDGVFMLDKERNVLIINDSAKRFLRTSQIPSFFEILSSFPKEYDLVSKIDKVISTKLPAQEQDVTISDNFFQTFITPVISPGSNQVIGVSFLLHDITLEKKLASMKEDFTNVMVHELRAPLTAIKGSSELLIEEGRLTKEEAYELLKIINSQSRLMLSEVSDLLDAAKIESGRLSINKTQNDIAQVINDVIKTFKAQAEKSQINLVSKISVLPPVVFDRLRITQVLNNLISNSLKFTKPGGEILISAKAAKGYVEVLVSDNGIGIPLDKQKNLFSKFYQVQVNSHTGLAGSGLGLFIVKGIVTAHDGSITLKSEEGKGTTISFTLPLISQFQTSAFKILN